MMTLDIRWHQRLENYIKALHQLALGVQLAEQRPLSDLEKQGLIQGFEFTHELAWNVMKDYFFSKDNQISQVRVMLLVNHLIKTSSKMGKYGWK